MEKLPSAMIITVYPILCLFFLSIFLQPGECMTVDRSSSVEDYGFDVPMEDFILTDKNNRHRRIYHDNGMLFLVLHELAVNFLKQLEREERIYLDARQQDAIIGKISGFYDHIRDHPALQNDRVLYSPNKREFDRMLPPPSAGVAFPNNKVSKRSGPYEESCQSDSGWVRYRYGDTQDYKRLTLFGETYFYVTRCRANSAPCRHIASGYRSQCLQKSSWVEAYGRHEGSDENQWERISVPTCCACATAALL